MALLPSISRPRLFRNTSRYEPSSNVEGLRLIPVECASATARPDAIADTYLELGRDAKSREQQHLFAAEGEVQARKYAAKSGALTYAAEQAKVSADRAKTAAEKASERYEHVRDVLGPYVQRKAVSSWGYVLRLLALLLGDIAGLSGAAIALGEYPALAVVQAISAGTATVTAGLAATQLRYQQQARERRTDSLPEALAPYRHLFGGPADEKRLQSAVFVVAALIALFVAGGVFALRTAIEGPLSGGTFGMLAAAVALASLINSWYHADVVADVVESAHHDMCRAVRQHRRLSGAQLIEDAEQASALEKSVITEYTHRGLAAAAHIEADKYRALMASPDVVGHGPAAVRRPAAPPTIKRARSA